MITEQNDRAGFTVYTCDRIGRGVSLVIDCETVRALHPLCRKRSGKLNTCRDAINQPVNIPLVVVAVREPNIDALLLIEKNNRADALANQGIDEIR